MFWSYTYLDLRGRGLLEQLAHPLLHLVQGRRIRQGGGQGGGRIGGCGRGIGLGKKGRKWKLCKTPFLKNYHRFS